LNVRFAPNADIAARRVNTTTARTTLLPNVRIRPVCGSRLYFNLDEPVFGTLLFQDLIGASDAV
jgi:hypothetical protein